MAKRTFTIYPSGYIKASSEISEQTFRKLVSEYSRSGATWSLIVAELKGTYGLENAKDIATAVEDERRYRKNKDAWDAYAN